MRHVQIFALAFFMGLSGAMRLFVGADMIRSASGMALDKAEGAAVTSAAPLRAVARRRDWVPVGSDHDEQG